MNLPTIFNIAIGLIFIYLVLSLLASQIQEVIATILKWRAENLTEAIENLILGDLDVESENNKDTYRLVDNLFSNSLIQNLDQRSKSWLVKIPKKIIALASKIPMLKRFASQNAQPTRKDINPSYIPAETFSTTILYELGIPKLGRLLTWLNAEKLIYNEIYSKINTLLIGDKYKSIAGNLFEPYYRLKENFKSVLEDYKQERYGLSSTIIRLRNQAENFKREIEEVLQSKSDVSLSDLEAQTLKYLINQIIDFVFTPDKKDKDLIIRLRPSLTTILELLDINSFTYKNCEEEFHSKSPLYKSFEFVQGEFNKISEILPTNLRKSLYSLALRSRIKVLDVEQHLDQFKQEIETWFDRSMDRASGVYKRNARGFAFLIGLVIAVSLNADTFYIVSRLSKDDALRNSIVSTSTQLVQNVQSSVNPSPTSSPSIIAKSSLPVNPSPTASPSPTAKSSSPAKPSPTSTLTLAPNTIERVKDNVDQSLSEITLPIGWNDNILDEQFQVLEPIKENETAEEKQNREKRENEKNRRKAKFFGHLIHPVLIMIMGWLITATAIMMGAPFWFDFLGLFINVRNTGSRPASKTDKN